ncbi:MAG: peptidoglycan DD-metalloendopeptidase family protein, partial [Propionicimonas sp.]
VTFAGTLAGRGVVVVSHGDLRTTYLPVDAAVTVGTSVAAGQRIGDLVGGHPCPGGTCLHWGLKRGADYLDPLSLLGEAALRLLPAEATQQVSDLVDYREAALSSGAKLPGLLTRPAAAAVGSPFGMRLHPIFHEWRLHNGVDLGAPCGSAIRAAAPGRVVRVSYDSASGHRLEIDHGVIGGHRLRTGYLHAQRYSVKVGQWVSRGEVVGKVGSTGWSTGCHLHFITWLEGRYTDPERFL